MGDNEDQPTPSEATLEPRLVMKGDNDKPFIEGGFFVAAYQRGYRWGREEVRQLLGDIKAHKQDAGKGEPTDYYLQPIVVLKRDDGSWELVDGQQRLTTLFLVTKYVATKIAGSKLGYWLTYETRQGSRDFLENLDFSRRDENIDFYHIAQAYDVIEKWFDEQPNATQAAINFHTALANWVNVIWYEAPPGTDATALFTRLNRDRIPLTDSELIKALVLSHSGAADGKSGRQQEIAAQWDGYERDLRDQQFWAFLTRSSAERPTHIDFLFESMTPKAGLRERPRYWTFTKVSEDIERRAAKMTAGRSAATAAFWRDVVERHGLLTGWFQDRYLYHRIGYLIQIGDSIQDLIDLSKLQTHSTFREALVDRTRKRLDLTADKVSLLRYGKDNSKSTDVLLLMNVETVLGSTDIGSRFSFHAYVDNWSLEHIHAQNSEAFEKEAERRDWLRTHKKKIEEFDWSPDQQADVEGLIGQIDAHLAMVEGKTDDLSFDGIFRRVLALFSAPGTDTTDEDMHGLGNLALLQRDLNSKLNNAVFALKREQVIALDQDGAYILPCTRNVFLKYYTAAADQQLSLWGPQDQGNYLAVLADRMTRLFGIEWEQRDRGKNHNLAWELAPVPEELIHEFSGRTSHIEQEADRLIAGYEAAHGHRPSKKEIIVMRARATRATRPEKEIHSLFDLTTDWRRRARKVLARDAVDWAKEVTSLPIARPTLRADDVPLDVVGAVAVSVVGAVEEKRSTWKHWNLWAEASRQTMGWRFASAEDREVVVGMIVDAAKQESLTLTPPELVTTPEVFRRPDGTTRFRPRHSVVFTSEALLAAEDRLLARAEDLSGPEVDLAVIERVTRKEHLLSAEQSKTLAGIAVSGRQVDLLVGPAGAGKTTAMHALKTAWTKAHGKGSVVGLAPSAVGAQVLAEDLGIGCENTAKWLHEFDRGRAQFRKGQLVIIDEATLAGTLTLDRLTALAADAGAKVLLVGDWAQLQSVDAGGAFSLLSSARPDTPELTEVHRFTHEWEKAASLDLRHGRVEVINTYMAKDRVHEGTTDEMMDAAYLAWAADVKGGRTSILVAEAMEMVTRFNRRARADRIVANPVGDIEVNLADGTQASEGDLVITRHNDRRLHTLRGGWVRNGDRWTVTRVHKDGSMQVQRLGVDLGGTVTLPAAYVAEHVDLGYAVTAHRAQGMTVDTSHVVVTGSTTRENVYVGMTRGRDSNIAYVALDKPDEGHAPPEPDEVNAHIVLYGVLQHTGVELSAHQMIVAEQERWSSIAQLGAEYETIGAVAQRDRWVAAIRSSGLTDAQVEQVLTSQSLGPLTAELRRAESDHYDIDRLLPVLVARRSLDDAEDIGAVLISRLQRAAQPRKSNRSPSPKLVVGLIPVADGPMSPEMAKVLGELADLMEGRAMTLAERAVEDQASWLKRLGTPPTIATNWRRWLHEVRTVAAYRDRYKVEGRRALGAPQNEAQKLDAARAEQAIRRGRAIADDAANAQDGRSRALEARGRAIG